MMEATRRSYLFSFFLLAGLTVVAAVGCGSGGTYPVSGKLEYPDGRPASELAGFSVLFTSEALHKTARGEIRDDGTYRLTTNRPNDGAYPGDYKVTVTQPHREPERTETRDPVVDLIYEDPVSTPLQATVKKENNHFTFKLERIKKRRK